MPLVKTKTRLDHEVESLIASANKHQPFAESIGHFAPHLADHINRCAGHDIWDRLSPRGQVAVLALVLKKHIQPAEIAHALNHHEPLDQLTRLADEAHERKQRAEGGAVDLPTFARGADDNTSGDRSGPAIGDLRAPIDPSLPEPQDSPRSVRNNNPGNVVDSNFARNQPGYAGSDGRFARYDTPDTGQAATGALLGKYADQGINTPHQIISKFAPPSENNTRKYAAHVANTLGVGPHDRIDMSDPGIRAIVQHAIGHYEGGRQADRYYDNWSQQRSGYARGGGDPDVADVGDDDLTSTQAMVPLVKPRPAPQGTAGLPTENFGRNNDEGVTEGVRQSGKLVAARDPAGNVHVETPRDPSSDKPAVWPPKENNSTVQEGDAPTVVAPAERRGSPDAWLGGRDTGAPVAEQFPAVKVVGPANAPSGRPTENGLPDYSNVDTEKVLASPPVKPAKKAAQPDLSDLLDDGLEHIDTGLRDTPAAPAQVAERQPVAAAAPAQVTKRQPQQPQQPQQQTYSDPVTGFLDMLTGQHRQQPNTGGGAVGFVNDLAGFESGRRNIVGLGQARGYYQITDPTWHDFAPRAGVDLAKYPTAMSAPQEVQAAVAAGIPMKRWAPKTLDKMRGAGWNLDLSKTMGENAAQNNQPMQQAQRAVTNTGAAFGATVNAAGQGLAGSLGNAKQLLAHQGSQLWGFMADHGYANHGEAWCGEFTGAVVHSAGYQPPKGAAVASNWLNWGTHVDPKDVRPGDVAVQKQSRYGGAAQPGKPGSHVGVVQDTGNGSFNLLAGNQGAPVTARNTGDFEFRRPPAGQGGQSAQQQQAQQGGGGGQSAQQQQPQQGGGGGGGQSAQQPAYSDNYGSQGISGVVNSGLSAAQKAIQGAPDLFQANRSWLIPLLTGLGGMASSNSPYLGTAILQGLGQGAQAYGKEAQSEADLAHSYAGTGATGAGIANTQSSTASLDLANFQHTLFNGPMGPTYSVINGKGLRENIPVADFKRRLAAGEQMRPVDPRTDLGGAGGGGGPQAAPNGGQGGGGQSPNAPFPQPVAAPAQQPSVGVNFDDGARKASEGENFYDPNSTVSKADRDKMFSGIRQTGLGATQNMPITGDQALNTSKMATNEGVGAPGWAAGARTHAIDIAHTLGRITGLGGSGPDNTETLAQLANKFGVTQAFQQALGSGQKSEQALETALVMTPNPSMTPQAMSELQAQILYQQQYKRDYAAFAELYHAANPNSTMEHLPQEFARINSPQKYAAEKHALAEIIRTRPDMIETMLHGGAGQKPDEWRAKIERGLAKRRAPEGTSRYFF